MTLTRAYDEFIDVLTCGATTERVADFCSSPETQARVCELIQRKKEGIVTREEIAEMEEYLTIEHVMIMTKARARQRLEA